MRCALSNLRPALAAARASQRSCWPFPELEVKDPPMIFLFFFLKWAWGWRRSSLTEGIYLFIYLLLKEFKCTHCIARTYAPNRSFQRCDTKSSDAYKPQC